MITEAFMRKIAMFVDVDNLGLSGRQFKEIFDDVNSAGKIVYGKIYGVIDRKHKEIIDLIVNRGYDMAPPMRVKKRGSKVFDNRILIDVMETVVANEKIDTIAVACAPADLVPLFSKLREYGVSIMSLDNLDKESSFFVDDVILGECDEDDEDDSIEELAAGFAEKTSGADKPFATPEPEISAEDENSAEEENEEAPEEEDADEDFEDNEAFLERVKNVFSGLSSDDIEEEEE